MKKLLFNLLFIFASVVSFAQSLPNVWFPTSGTDTYAVNIGNYGGAYNNKVCLVEFGNANTGASTINVTSSSGALGAKSLRIWDGSAWVALVSGDITAGLKCMLIYDQTSGFMQVMKLRNEGSGGSTPDLQAVLDEGSSANIGDTQSTLTAQDASYYSQWSVNPNTAEIVNSDVGNTQSASLNLSPSGFQINDTWQNRGIQGAADYSANIQANDFAQKNYVDSRTGNAAADGTTKGIASFTANDFDASSGNISIDYTNGQASSTSNKGFLTSADYTEFNTETFIVACSDETSSVSASTNKVTFRMPRARTLSAVRASLTTAQASGSTFTIDIHETGTTILSTKITIDNTEKTSTTAATPPVISDSSLADDAEITIDVDQIGNGSATGLKVTFIWN